LVWRAQALDEGCEHSADFVGELRDGCEIGIPQVPEPDCQVENRIQLG
jgi:hypothetical protein